MSAKRTILMGLPVLAFWAFVGTAARADTDEISGSIVRDPDKEIHDLDLDPGEATAGAPKDRFFIQGRFRRKGWKVYIGRRQMNLSGKGNFQVGVPVRKAITPLVFTLLGPGKKREQETIEIRVTGFDALKKRLEVAKTPPPSAPPLAALPYMLAPPAPVPPVAKVAPVSKLAPVAKAAPVPKPAPVAKAAPAPKPAPVAKSAPPPVLEPAEPAIAEAPARAPSATETPDSSLQLLNFRFFSVIASQDTPAAALSSSDSYSVGFSWDPSYRFTDELGALLDVSVMPFRKADGTYFPALEYAALASFPRSYLLHAELGVGAESWLGYAGTSAVVEGALSLRMHSPLIWSLQLNWLFLGYSILMEDTHPRHLKVGLEIGF